MLIKLPELRRQLSTQPSARSEFTDSDPRKLSHLSLEQQKKRAKELLRAVQAQDPAAIERLRTISPGAGKPQLSDAQRVVAREHGFNNWADFRAHIEHVRIARAAIAQGKLAALDGDSHTLHIRCGSDIAHALAVAGFVGDLLVFADPYVQGPVPKTDSLAEFIRIRAQFLSESLAVTPAVARLSEKYAAEHAKQMLQHEDTLNVAKRLTQEYEALDRAHEYPRVALWFEHDSYDQLILAKLLDYFSDPAKRPKRIEFICVSHFPGVKRFIGIGQLPPEAMRVLWEQFGVVTEAQFDLGKRAWTAITSPTPDPLAALIDTGTPAQPTMATALARHMQELPSAVNGLSLTEQLTLQILADKGPMNAAQLFGWYTNHYEPLPFLGDSGYWSVIFGLAKAVRPAVAIREGGPKPNDWYVEMTPLGGDLLSGKANWLALNVVERWVGGIHVRR